MEFPKIILSESEKNEQWMKQAADAAIEKFKTQSVRTKYLTSVFNAYNGIANSKAFDYLTKTYGISSRTRYIDYKIGRTKIDQLVGEFLTFKLNSTVTTVNREAKVAKGNKIMMNLGLAHSKEILEEVKNKYDIDAFPNVKIPDRNDPNLWRNIKTENEKVMQHIIDHKVASEDMKYKLSKDLTNNFIACECFGKVERDIDNNVTYRSIELKDAIFQESTDDPFLMRTPYIGERRFMYKHEILNEFNLSASERQKIDSCFFGTDNDNDSYDYEVIQGSKAYAVYTIQFKSLRPVYTKIDYRKDSKIPYRTNMNPNYVQKNFDKIKYEIEKEKYKLETKYKEEIYEVIRIGKDIYPKKHMGLKNYTIQTALGGKKKKALYDYTGMLFRTVNGDRVSLQDLIYNLSISYNVVLFQINRELNKLKGKVLTYDKAFIGKDSFTKVLRRATEDGIVGYDSSMLGQDEPEFLRQVKEVVGEIDLGASQGLGILINLKQELEQTLDKITGVNENRQGFQKASQTATGINTSIEASRSITYPYFYAFGRYVENVLLRIAEQVKIDTVFTDNENSLILGDDEKSYLRATIDLCFDDYGITLSDGKKESEIRQRLTSLYDAQINSRELRAHDIARAEMQETFVEYVNVLENAWKEISEANQKMQQSKERIEDKKLQTQMQMAKEDREDRQQHEIDLELVIGEIKKELKYIEGKIKGANEGQKAVSNSVLEDQKSRNQKDIVKEQAAQQDNNEMSVY